MIPSLPLQAIIDKWRDVLKTDTAIANYCTTAYNTPLTVYVGLPRRDPPTAKDCPYIIILPGAKREGTDSAENRYALSVGWAVHEDSDADVTGNVVEVVGISRCNALGQLILQAIDEASEDNPIASVDYEIDVVDHYPQIVGQLDIEIAIASVHAGALSY